MSDNVSKGVTKNVAFKTAGKKIAYRAPLEMLKIEIFLISIGVPYVVFLPDNVL